MSNAKEYSCEFIIHPDEKLLNDRVLKFIGCPTLAITKGGRFFAGWYFGGIREPHMDNCNVIVMSDDGVNWSRPILAIPSSKSRNVHALDIQLWIAPDGALYVFWVQNDAQISVDGKRPKNLPAHLPWISVDGYDFGDFEHSAWLSICRDPDAQELVFEEPRCIGTGFLRCKPTVLDSGRWLLFNYDQLSDRYAYSISDDAGKTYEKRHGAVKLLTPFDEAMAYQMLDGRIRMLARTKLGYLAESYSSDGGNSWSEASLTDIASPNTRIFVSRTPSGRVLLVNNDSTEVRKNMTVYLSDDDGMTWKYKCLVDEREATSYPDVEFYNGRIYLIYDRERTGAKEIIVTDFTEDDVMNSSFRPTLRVIQKL